ncbi:DUF2325 domain-containing protein [Lactobacillus xylocopicola]|uniref:V-type sodium ATP synthase subunit n=1 Tax=Lactobacillus xylocopicola TaxID=2976676 RepID=A0ABM8BHW6_9LACO|nr:DUF2325 domain-containing protein [Lactobacillus xylocopicola]BDR60708.1 V-type sodium ATP synthase subunit [Lactobacillus xylocopicola]
MFDYRNHLKQILERTTGDDRSLRNGLAAIKLLLGLADDESGATAANRSPEIRVDQAQLNHLLTSLTKLVQNPADASAQNVAIRALHQLMQAPESESTWRQNLTKLEEALRAAKTSQETTNRKIFEQALQVTKPPRRDYRKGKRYTVIRLLSGCDLINTGNRRVYTLAESQIHALNLSSGDIVEAVPASSPGYEAEILRVVGHRQLASMEVDQISTFKYAVVQGRAGHLAISRNVKGEKLRIRGKSVLLPVDASWYQEGGPGLSDGSIVDLAWYDGDVRIKKNPAAAVRIRWVYQVEQAERAARPLKKKAKQDRQLEELPRLDLDLHYQRVGIAVGNNQNEAILEGVVRRYHGLPFAIDAFQGKRKVIEQQLKDLDIVILVTAFAAHDSTWNISEYASKYNIKFAVSSSKGYQAFERALYRAEKGLPAYEGNQTIDYRRLAH